MKKAIIAAAILAAFSITPTQALTVYEEGYPTGSGGSWTADFGGGDFYSHRGGGWADGESETVNITGRRWSTDWVTISCPGALNDCVYGQGTFYDRTFDSRDRGVDSADDKKTAPPDNKKRDACLKNCADTQANENALCEDRAIGVTEGSGLIATGIYLRTKWVRVPFKLLGYEIAAREVWATGGAIGATYGAICKARASERFQKCTGQTCKS